MQTRWRIGVGLWLVCLSVLTSARCRVWASDLTLWADAAAKAPLKPRTVMNDGRAHELAGDPVYAEAAYRKVIWLSFLNGRSLYIQRFSQAAAETNIAHLRMKDGHLATAIRILDGTLSQYPDFPYAHYNRGAILWMVGACDEAKTEYRKALMGDSQLPAPEGTCVPSASTSASAS